ncbi:hypothetical protein [Schlesneria paludicola]|uniref:hypothetical protein n=1 Tax=Schlesneria paludicola TaxID=360056 RepID=UPI00029A5882|nr:hypothetical protein [Schlesneria paludicola]
MAIEFLLRIKTMPAYTTISWEFAKRDREGLVSRFYAALIDESISFDGVFPWGCDEKMPFEEIVSWNQMKLDGDFTIGFTQDVSHDYRQILMRVMPFSECRIFLVNSKANIEFNCIVPEDEITVENCEPLLKGCLRTWFHLPVLAIETYGEIGANVGSKRISSGQPPSASLFAIVDRECHTYESDPEFDQTLLGRGCLLRRKGSSIGDH